MKRPFNSLIASVVFIFLVFIPCKKVSAQPGADVSYQEFYDNLSPYGQWIEDPQYGYVWIPNAEEDFRPYYTRGYWVMTDYGNTWVSEYPWGWAPFHYGRWVYDSYYGWVWVPGSEWGPAWVSWRYGDGYYGWAPLTPGFDIGMGFGSYWCPDDWWVFLPPQYIYRPRYYNYWHGPNGNSVIIRNTRPVPHTYTNPHTNTIYVTGPRAEDVQSVTNQPVKVYHINSTTRPGAVNVNGNAIAMYRPVTIQNKTSNGGRPAPTRVVTAPQPINKPQAVGTNAGQRPPFITGAPPSNTPVANPVTQPPVQQQQNYQPPTPPVQNNRQRPVQQQQNYQPPQPPVQHYQQQQVQPPQRTYQAPPTPPVQQQRSFTPPAPPVQRSAPPPPTPPVQRQAPAPTPPPARPQQQNNSSLRH